MWKINGKIISAVTPLLKENQYKNLIFDNNFLRRPLLQPDVVYVNIFSQSYICTYAGWQETALAKIQSTLVNPSLVCFYRSLSPSHTFTLPSAFYYES